jgi:2-keto-4-pentenoate hydratase
MAATTTERAGQAARVIWDAWMAGVLLGDGLPEACRPASVAEGYACQAELDPFGGARRGWKIAATGAGGRKTLGVEHPLAGPLYARFETPPGGRLPVGRRMGIAEAEFAFTMAAALPPREAPYERADVLAALGAFHPAIEAPDTRYAAHREAGAAQLVADAGLAGSYGIGEPVSVYDPASLPEHELTLLHNGAPVAEGRGSTVLGDPVEAVRWLADELSAHGRGLEAGDVVLTGACAVIKEYAAGDELTADFGALGRITVTLA